MKDKVLLLLLAVSGSVDAALEPITGMGGRAQAVKIIVAIGEWISALGAAVSGLALTIYAVQMMIGDKDQAVSGMKYAGIGLVVCGASWLIVNAAVTAQ